MESEDPWNTHTILRKNYRTKEDKKIREKGAIKSGNFVTQKKTGDREISDKMRKLDEDPENLNHKKVDKALSLLIRETRTKLRISQKDLAKSINEKPVVINQYENGTAIPNNQLIGRLENALNIFLRGKKKGEPKNNNQKKK